MYCPNCASQVHSDVKFCTRCGINLNSISDLLSGRIIDTQHSEQMMSVLEKCHNGYLSTMIGLGLVITTLLIVIAAMAFGVILAAISGVVFLGWAIPAIAQGVSRWLSARREMGLMLEERLDEKRQEEPQKRLSSEVILTESKSFAGSVTDRTTATLNQRA